MINRCLYVLVLLISVGCQGNLQGEPTPIPTWTPPPVLEPQTEASIETVWGAPLIVGLAEQHQAPAMLIHRDRLFMTWTGADQNEARHYMQGTRGAYILALRAFYPFDQTLYPAGDEGVLLLWLDRGTADESLQLWSARANLQSVAEYGNNPVSGMRTSRYAALWHENDVLIVWSGGETVYNHLYLNQVDLLARPSRNDLLRYEADLPALIRDSDGKITVYWHENQYRELWRGDLIMGESATTLENPERLLTMPDRPASEAILDYQVAYDNTHAYHLWQIRTASGDQRALISIARIDSPTIPAPQPFGVQVETSYIVQTGFNHRGQVLGASPLEQGSAWAVALEGQHPILPMLINQGDGLALAYFEDGAVKGYQHLTDSGQLIGAPSLAVDRNRNFYVAWSAVDGGGMSRFYLIGSR